MNPRERMAIATARDSRQRWIIGARAPVGELLWPALGDSPADGGRVCAGIVVVHLARRAGGVGARLHQRPDCPLAVLLGHLRAALLALPGVDSMVRGALALAAARCADGAG